MHGSTAAGVLACTQTVANQRQTVGGIACAEPNSPPHGRGMSLMCAANSMTCMVMSIRCRYISEMQASRYRCRDACGCSAKSHGHRDGGTAISEMEMRQVYRGGDTVIDATGVRSMCRHLQRTPRSRTPRRCPWTPGAYPPHSPRTQSPTMVRLHICPRRMPRTPPLRRLPCACLCTDSGKSAPKSERHVVHRKLQVGVVVRRVVA